MASVESTIPDLLLTHLGKLNLSPKLPVAYPNLPFKPPSGSYLEARFMPNTNVDRFLGDNDTVQYQGLLQVTLVVLSAGGIIDPLKIAAQVAAHFAKGTILQGSGVKVRVYNKPSVASTLQDTDRLRIPITIPYRCFH